MPTPPKTEIAPLRLTKEELQDAELKREAYGLRTRSDIFRFALKRLKLPK